MEYTVDDIKIISWPEPVRNRPEMYYKHLGSKGCLWLMEEVLESILNEKFFCKASFVEIRYTRHEEVVIEYNGRGIPIDISDEKGVSEPIIYRALMGLFCGRYSEDDIKKYGHMVEIGAILNAACKVLRIYSSVSNKYYNVSFYQGCLSSPLSECPNNNSLNKLQFRFDSAVLGDFKISKEMLKNLAEIFQSKYKKAQISYVS